MDENQKAIVLAIPNATTNVGFGQYHDFTCVEVCLGSDYVDWFARECGEPSPPAKRLLDFNAELYRVMTAREVALMAAMAPTSPATPAKPNARAHQGPCCSQKSCNPAPRGDCSASCAGS